MSISIATWNVNSVKSRLQHLLEWLKREPIDIVLLQELKCVDEAFPRMEIEELGYNIATFGEKTYNGVAILSKFPLEDVRRGLPGEDEDTHARYIEAVVSIGGRWTVDGGPKVSFLSTVHRPPPTAMRVASVYVPNGQTPDSDKFAYKLRFLKRLHAHAQELLRLEEMLVIGGDYNVAPYDIDVHNPQAWANTVLCHPAARERLRTMLHAGLYDALRTKYPNLHSAYTWWDYRANGFDRDDGLCIDHLLLSPQAADRLCDCRIEKAIRALEKASDHAPVVAQFAL